MTVRILIGENEELKELAQEYPQQASIIEEMLKAAETDEDEADEDEEEDVKSATE